MSWPGGSWPAQPAYGGYSTAVPPPAIGPMAPGPGAYSSMPPDQYAQWQQWQTYQQQYAQWHAQYGEQYARQMGTPIAAVPTPAMPMAVPTAAPPPSFAAPPPPAEPHPDTLVARKAPAPPPPAQVDEQGQKTAEELAFDEQFRKWEEEFENWKSKNANHPDKSAYREYEKKFIDCRKKLLERREQLRNKRLAELAAAKASAPQYQQPPPPPPAEHHGMGMGLFANALGGGSGGGGIPGLDLLNEHRASEPKKAPEVTEIIELDDDNDNDIKPDLNRVNERLVSSNPVTALASLLKDPKVSALLNIITNNAQGGGGGLSNLPSGQTDILQKLHSAAGAVVNANGGMPGTPLVQPQLPVPAIRTPTSLHSGDDRSREFDGRSFPYQQQQQQQPPPLPYQPPNGLNFAGIPGVSAPPPSMVNNGYGFQPAMPAAAAPPPSYAAAAPPPIDSFAPALVAPPSLMSLDLSRPPPLQGSPAPSNASSSTSQQRPSRWGQDKPPNGRDFPQDSAAAQQKTTSRWGMKDRPVPQQSQKPQQQQQQQPRQPIPGPKNGGNAPKPPKEVLDERNLPGYYSGHLNELQVDPELGTPCAVPKPEWMTEDEYDEIFDRFENVEVFEERKYKMELAIRMLEQKKKKEQLMNGGGDRLLSAKRANPFAKDDDFFRPKQVIDYSNGTPQVIDYGHSSGPNNNQGNNNFGKPPERPGQGGYFEPRRFDYNHSQQGNDNTPFIVEKPPHYSDSSTNKLASMHNNPNPDESNPSYPCKFILMNDNRPNRPSTKRGKRASSIRKQKLREQQQQQGQQDNQPGQQQQQVPTQPSPPPPKQHNNGVQLNRQLPRQIIPLDALLPTAEQLGLLEGPDEPPFHPAAMQDEPLSDYELEMKRGEPVDDPTVAAPCTIVPIEGLLMKPGRFQRPGKICFVMRGLPGSGKSYLARMIKDCEVKQGGQPPRVLSLDDYFLVDTEEREPDPKTGRPVLVTKSEYKYDGDMEDIYMQNLVKAFKRTITEDVFHFIIVDCPNEHLKYYNEFYAFARTNGFKVFTVTLQTEIDLCIEQNIHGRTPDEIRSYANNWTLGPDDHPLINAGILFDDAGHPQETTVVADMDLCSDDEDGLPKVAVEEDAEEGAKGGDGEGVEPAAEDGSAKPDVDEDSNVEAPEPGWTASASRRDVPRP